MTEYVTKAEAAEILRCDPKTVSRLIARRRRGLKAFKPHGRVLIRRKDVLDFIKAAEVGR